MQIGKIVEYGGLASLYFNFILYLIKILTGQVPYGKN